MYRGDLWLLLAVCALAAGLQTLYFTGVVGSDDLGYLSVAEAARAGHLEFPAHGHMQPRVVIWKPVQWIISLLPGNSFTLALPSMLSVWVVLFTVARLDRRWGSGAGWLAMALLALVPVNVVIASTLLPDSIGSALAWVAIAIAAGPLLQRDSRRPLARCALAGFLMAAGYNAKEPVLFFIPGVFLYILLTYPRQRWAWARGVALGCGAAVWIAGEAVWLWRATGDPLFHVHAASLSQRNFYAPPIEHTAKGLIFYWTEYARWLALPTSDFGPVGPILLVGTLAAVAAARTPWTKLLLCTVLPAAVFLSIGSTDFGRYTPIVHQSRYFLPILPALSLVAAGVIGDRWRRHPRWRPAMSLAGVVLVLASLVAPDRIAGKWYHAGTFSAGQQVLAQLGVASTEGVASASTGGVPWPSGSSLPRRHATPPSTARLYASDLTATRFAALIRWFRLPEIEVIKDPPQTPEDWAARYAGAHILVSRLDRTKPIAKHGYRSLYGPSLEALSTFKLVSRAAPAASRLAAIWAWWTGSPSPAYDDYAFEAWRIFAASTRPSGDSAPPTVR